ncbi:hypothetical protein [Amycolatopsis sp. NPDC059021]|uniref:hypothetical protein n=1 Tax=Amycolatopsis sp. NPDC059021 TaxID=3346704 RepID=UPI00366E59F5
MDALVFADSGEGSTEVIEVDGVVDLLGREAASAYRHVVLFADVAGRPPFDSEPGTQLIHRGSGLVGGDECLGLVRVELACPSKFESVDGWWSRFGGVW